MTGAGVKNDDPVVVVGFSFKFPQNAVSEESFWDIILHGTSTMTEVPGDRYDINGYHGHGRTQHGMLPCRGGHFLKDDIATFDSQFFSMSAEESRATDPQLRILLETSYHALESAGIPLESVKGSMASVFVGGIGSGEYSSLYGADDEINTKYQATGTSMAMLSNRLSWFYDFRGPSLTLDTACSSSLVALHLASQSLLQGESDMSLVCGAQLQLEPRSLSTQLARLQFLSPDSHCYSFDDRANGYSRGEGVGVVVLKRLSKALENGDKIRAIIRATASNQDGHTPSVTQPSPAAQASLICKAYEHIGSDYSSTGYFEAHGTGTATGDPIEIRGISAAFSAHRTIENPLFIGSVKANVGHLEASSGIAGLIKTILILEKGEIPPVALLQRLNPAIKSKEWNLQFPTSPLPWPTNGFRRASVNSFGFGGTNAHVILDDAFHFLQSRGVHGFHNTSLPTQFLEYPGAPIRTTNEAPNNEGPGPAEADVRPLLLFPLSSSDENGIQRQATALAHHLMEIDTKIEYKYLQDLAYTLGGRRTTLPWKSFAIGSSTEDLAEDAWDQTMGPMHTNKRPKVHFVFTGQGSQWPSMGKELLQYRTFRDSLQRSDHYFCSIGATWSILEEIHSSSRIHNPDIAQPVTTALQVALVNLLMSWGITPESVVGHSSGEIAAAYCAGAITEESAWRIAYFRGQVTQKLAIESPGQGAMLAVALSETEIQPYVNAAIGMTDSNSLRCSCVNSVKNTTMSGTSEHIDKLASHMQSNGIFSRKLNVPVAYHSAQMLTVASTYRALLDGRLEPQTTGPRRTQMMYFSSVEGSILSTNALSHADYWVSNLVSKVKFSDAIQQLITSFSVKTDSESDAEREQDLHCLVEVGPHCALERPVKDHITSRLGWAYEYTLRRGASATRTMKMLAGRVYSRGCPIEFAAVNNHAAFQHPPEVLHTLPPYQFCHENSYWLESRLSRNHRFRERPRHDLLGNPSRDWCPLAPKWRFTIRTTDLPWVLDHKIQNTVIYPAAGMLVTVLEGVRSLVRDTPEVTGFRLRDVSITSALVIPLTDDGIETQLHLHSWDDSHSDKLAQAWNFRFYSVVTGEWKLHCSGKICVEQVSNGLGSEAVGRNHSSSVMGTSFEALRCRCTSTMSHSQYYREFATKGAQFGSSFQTLRNISVNYDGREATAIVHRDEWDKLVKQQKLTDHAIHPTTLDSLIHVIFAAASSDWENLNSLVPTRFLEIYFSCGLLEASAWQPMNLYGCITGSGISSVDGDAIAMDRTTSKPLVMIRGCRLNSINSVRDHTEPLLESSSLFHRVEWKPDIALMQSDEIMKYCKQGPTEINIDNYRRGFEVVSRHFMSAALEKCDDYPHGNRKPHLEKYTRWARDFLDSEQASTIELLQRLPGFEGNTLNSRYVDEFASSSSEASKFVLFGQNLKGILLGEIDPLGFLMNHGVLESIYKSSLFQISSTRLAAYIDLLAHKTSDLELIEVGAGTGSGTDIIIETLSCHGRFPGASARFSRYDFTDISPSFLADAQDRYAQHTGIMNFATLDLERDPIEQGFEAHSYDAVIAISVLHATCSISNTLMNVKKLLKPGGQLIFIEPTNLKLAAIQFFSGVLPGWWLSSEDFRSSSPLMSIDSWRRSLLQAGFDGLSLAMSDGEEDMHGLTVMVSTVPSLPLHETALSTVIVAETPEQNELGISIQSSLSSQFLNRCDLVTSEAYISTRNQYERCICLVELGQPIMDRMSETQFRALQRMVQDSKQIFWVNDSCGSDAEKPESSMISGFSKSVTREKLHLTFSHINLNTMPVASMSPILLRIVDRLAGTHPSDIETDLLEQHGTIYVPRAIEAPDINSMLHEDLNNTQKQYVRINKGNQVPVQLKFTPGRLDSFHFIHDAQTDLPLNDDEVEVSVKAVGINFKDVMVALNRVNDNHIGQEFAGDIRKVGSAAANCFSPGDRVCGIAIGCYSTYVRAKCTNTLRIPTSMPYVEACAAPLAFATAQYGLRHLGQLKRGETVLIHSAAGAVGQAAIQIAQHIGATVLVTVSSHEKKQWLMDQYGIPDSHLFSSRYTFCHQLMQKTHGAGVDVVLNSLSGRLLQETWRILAPFGRFIEIGKRDINGFKDLPMEPFERNISFCSVDLAIVMKHNPKLMGQILTEVEQLVLNESTRKYSAPQPLTVFKPSGLEDAFRSLQTGRHVGKLAIDWAQEDTIEVFGKSQSDRELDGDATYLIAGGLGGIGRSVAEWMSKHGAKHLILLGRSGANSDQAKDLVTRLETAGVHVYAPPCDICDIDALVSVVRHAQETMPPIKGCVQSSMVVVNRLFSDYSLEEFQAAIDPKVRGTWNLHRLLPSGLDFFVILSSLAGIHGASSQSNYAAASSFLDAFARYRHARGEKCISLDLGIMENIGYIAERIDIARTLAMTYTDHKCLRERDLHCILKYVCNLNPSHANNPASPWETQLIAAMTTPAFVKRGGTIQDHGWMRLPMFRHLYRMERNTTLTASQTAQEDSAGSQLRATVTVDDAATIVTTLLARRLARSLAIPVDTVSTRKPPHSFGVDSLVAVELVHWFTTEIRADIPVVQILGNKSIAELGRLAAETSEHFIGREKRRN